MNKYLTREQILAAELPVEIVDAPEWGGKMRVRGMDALTMQEFAKGLDGLTDQQVRVRAVALSLVDESGSLLFSTENGDLEALAKKYFAVIRRLSDIVFRMNKGGRQAQAELKENFKPAQGEGSPLS